MKLINTPIPDLFVIEPTVFRDDRGCFFEAYNELTFKQHGIETKFVQDNQSLSTYGTIRGLHFQIGPMAQAKLVRVVHGSVLDVAVDIRTGSPTFGQWYSTELSAENFRQMFIPRGFAHGFACLSEKAIFCYKCDNFYSKEHDRGLRYDDPQLAIDWKIPHRNRILSAKDQSLPKLNDLELKL